MQGVEFFGGPFDVALTKVLGRPADREGFGLLHSYGCGRREWETFAFLLRDFDGHLLTHEELEALQLATIDELVWWKAKKRAEQHPCPTCQGNGWVDGLFVKRGWRGDRHAY